MRSRLLDGWKVSLRDAADPAGDTVATSTAIGGGRAQCVSFVAPGMGAAHAVVLGAPVIGGAAHYGYFFRGHRFRDAWPGRALLCRLSGRVPVCTHDPVCLRDECLHLQRAQDCP